MIDGKFSDRLKDLCGDYYETYMESPPIPVSTYTRMNSLLTGDELFPSLHQMKKKDADRILEEIEGLKSEIE